jgi:ankyrin repeat protein
VSQQYLWIYQATVPTNVLEVLKLLRRRSQYPNPDDRLTLGQFTLRNTTMSGALVPTARGSFQQTGQLDWVSLSKSTFTFGLDVLVRLSKAELDPATVAIGLITCNRFVIRAEAQKRIYDALSNLKSFSSYGKLVWFGFGIKSTINDLADTEPGMACVALCACMSISYDSFYVAEVLREFCKFQETPPNIIPSVHQWKALVHICAGSVSNSKFPTLLEGLIRLVCPGTGISFHQPTSTNVLAKAIGALADVSNDKLANITIAGGLDCIWLAAISEWALALDVEVRVDSGCTVYRSSTNGDRCFPAVTIIFVSGNEQPTQLSKCHVVPKGHKFWGDLDLDQPRFRGGRSEWTNILADAFGPHLISLLQGTLQHSFALILFDASRLAEECYRYGPMKRGTQPNSAEHSFPFRRFHFSHPSSRGQPFLKFAAKRLPELAVAIDVLNQDEVQSYTSATWKRAIDRITLECMCEWCSSEQTAYDDYPPQFCLELIAETIIIFLWILSVTEMDSSIKPSSHGLQLLYTIHRGRSHRMKDIRNRRKYWNPTQPAYFPTSSVDILTAALAIFSGSTDSGSDIRKESSALSHDGICVFFKVFEDLNLSPEEASIVRVVAGQIHFQEAKYERINDLAGTARVPRDDLGPHTSYSLVVQETPQQGSLAAAYKISSNTCSYEYLLGISRLELAIAKSVQGSIRCEDPCDWSFDYQAREAIIFVPKCMTQRGKLSGEPPLLVPQWSLVSVPRSGTYEPIKLQIMQAPICRLYLEIAKQDGIYQLVYLGLCTRCLNGFFPSPDFIQEQMSPSRELDHLPHSASEGSVTVTLPSETGAWINKHFEIFVITSSGCEVKEMSIGGQVSIPTVSKNDENGVGKSALHTAATVGHRGLLQLLLQGGADKSYTVRQEETVLHCAAREGHNEAVKLLVARGIELDSRDEAGQTSLSRAARNGHRSIVKLMIGYGAQQDARDNYGQTALVWAAALGHLAVVELLLQGDADINTSEKNSGKTALQAAAGGGHLVVVERLLQEKADVNAAAARSNGRTSLQAAAGGGHLAVVERLLQEKVDVNAAAAEYSGRTALQAAAEGGHFVVVERLLEEKANVNATAAARYSGRTALQAAAEGGHLVVVGRLLQEKADVNAAAAEGSGRTALQAAARGGHLTVVERLLEEKADVNAAAAEGFFETIALPTTEGRTALRVAVEGRTALQAAAEGGHLAVVERLLQEKADINAAAGRSNGRTALQAAAGGGHLAVVERLLQGKADVNATAGESGRTALQAAAEGGHLAVVEQLLQEKADVNAAAARESGSTALQAAARRGHLAIVERLIKEKADVNAAVAAAAGAAGDCGRTALQAAAEGGHLAVAERLLQEKADVNAAAARSSGRTSLQAAAGGGHLAVVERLLREKADVNAAAARSDGRTALQAAAGGGHLAVVERLLQEKAGVNTATIGDSGSTALLAAARGGHLATVERLLKEKANVNVTAMGTLENYRRTTLQAAAEGGHLAVVKRLLQEKADVNAAAGRYNGRTALQAAAGGGYLAVVELLLQEKADVNATAGESGRTALQAAAEGGHLAVVEQLLQKKADVNATKAKECGISALEAAAKGGHLAVVKRLLQEKVNINPTPGFKNLALDAAAREGHMKVVECLHQAGAK